MRRAATFELFEVKLGELVDSFGRNQAHLRSSAYAESSLRNDFLLPFWRALGWDVENEDGLLQPLREVEVESRVDIAGKNKRADYLFRTDGIERFVCEAKKPSEDLSPKHAYQAQRYAFNLKLLVATLTNFQALSVYVVGGRPEQDRPWDASKTWHFTEYMAAARELWNLFSREQVGAGSLDRYVASLPKRAVKGKLRQGWLITPERVRTVDADFLDFIETQRERLAKDLVKSNPRYTWTDEVLNESIQRVLDRILFVRICEDRDIDTGRSLELICQEWRNIRTAKSPLYPRFVAHFNALDQTFNGALFRKGHESERLNVSDDFLNDLVGDLSSEDSPYLFNTLPVEILGSVYERFIGKVVRLTKGGRVKVELKPDVRKAGGVFYTPAYIVDHIVSQTVGKLIATSSPREIAKMRFLDPACGSGSFLISIFAAVCERYLQWYTDNPKQQKAEFCYYDDVQNLHLTTNQKHLILLQSVYGIDVDYQAIEVTMLSLYLKILEGETRTTLGRQQMLFPKQTFLPDLSKNIKCGNSLISTDFHSIAASEDDDATPLKLDIFDWDHEFSGVMKSGGFDAIIGNPPYGAEIEADDARYLKSAYTTASSDLDTYSLFMEQAIKKSKAAGLVSMIVPTGWYSGHKFSRIRRYVAMTTDPQEFVNLPYDVFEAWVDTTVFVCEKRRKPTTWPRISAPPVRLKTFPKKYKISSPREFLEGNIVADFPLWFSTGTDEYLTYADAITTSLLSRLITECLPLGHYADVQRGITPMHLHASSDIPNARQAFTGTVRRYAISTRELGFVRFDESLAEPKPERYFEGPRLLLRELISRQFRLQATFTSTPFVTNKSMQSILLRTDETDLRFILACLNSKLMSWFFCIAPTSPSGTTFQRSF